MSIAWDDGMNDEFITFHQKFELISMKKDLTKRISTLRDTKFKLVKSINFVYQNHIEKEND